MRKIIIVILLALSLYSCTIVGQKKQPMTDEIYIEYVLQYAEYRREKDQVLAEDDFDTVKKFNKKIKDLHRKYPEAALYPLRLSSERQVILNQKLEAARQESETKNE